MTDETTRVLVRMNDVAFALSESARFGHTLSRLQLQKFIYLSDVVGYVFEMLPPAQAHVTYKRGPFDAAIQNAVDALLFRGFVEASGVQKDSLGNIHANYRLTSAGEQWCALTRERMVFEKDRQVAAAIANHVEELGWTRLKKLVYAEPTFMTTRLQGFGKELNINDGLKNTASALFGLLDVGLRSGFPNSSRDPYLIIQLLFRYLDQADALRRQES